MPGHIYVHMHVRIITVTGPVKMDQVGTNYITLERLLRDKHSRVYSLEDTHI